MPSFLSIFLFISQFRVRSLLMHRIGKNSILQHLVRHNRVILLSPFSSANNYFESLNLLINADMKIQQIYSISSSFLRQRNVSEPEDSVRYILAHVAQLGYTRSSFYANEDRTLTPEQLQSFLNGLVKRIDRTPVQYILGNWDFYGLTLNCREPILIPRPETEELVERIINTNILQKISTPRILDVGAGTGAIGIAMAYHIPSLTCLAIDINDQAVSLANSNARSIFGDQYERRYNCIHSSFDQFYTNSSKVIVDDDDSSSTTIEHQLFDMIISNPPYIPTSQLASLDPEVRLHEDSVALDGGVDGLDIVLQLVRAAPALLRKGGPRELWMEVAEHHPAMLERIIPEIAGTQLVHLSTTSLYLISYDVCMSLLFYDCPVY